MHGKHNGKAVERTLHSDSWYLPQLSHSSEPFSFLPMKNGSFCRGQKKKLEEDDTTFVEQFEWPKINNCVGEFAKNRRSISNMMGMYTKYLNISGRCCSSKVLIHQEVHQILMPRKHHHQHTHNIVCHRVITSVGFF